MKSYDGKTILTIIGIVSLTILAFIFTVGYILSNIETENKLEGYTISISFIGLFATFGGALVGALIAGRYSLKTVNEQRKMNQIQSINEIQSILLFYDEALIKFYGQIFESIGTNNEEVKKRIYNKETSDYNKFFDELEKKEDKPLKVRIESNKYEELKNI